MQEAIASHSEEASSTDDVHDGLRNLPALIDTLI
jgi:hypothetical protein